MDIRVGHGYDVHALAEGLRLVLCGVEVEHYKGCIAHSDGDVAIHAICDALLGALALGDIGKLFPDSDMRYKSGWRSKDQKLHPRWQQPHFQPL